MKTPRRIVVVRVSVIACSIILASGFIAWRMGGCAAKNAPPTATPSNQNGPVMSGSKSLIIAEPPDSVRKDDPEQVNESELFSSSKSGAIVRPRDVKDDPKNEEPETPPDKPNRQSDDRPKSDSTDDDAR